MTDRYVQAQCRCGWESEPVRVNEDVINGEWFARRDVAVEYRLHYDDSHRPLPMFITWTANFDTAVST